MRALADAALRYAIRPAAAIVGAANYVLKLAVVGAAADVAVDRNVSHGGSEQKFDAELNGARAMGVDGMKEGGPCLAAGRSSGVIGGARSGARRR
jgi:hypothetical protein